MVLGFRLSVLASCPFVLALGVPGDCEVKCSDVLPSSKEACMAASCCEVGAPRAVGKPGGTGFRETSHIEFM